MLMRRASRRGFFKPAFVVCFDGVSSSRALMLAQPCSPVTRSTVWIDKTSFVTGCGYTVGLLLPLAGVHNMLVVGISAMASALGLRS
jgi:hypothetical protein